MKSLAAVLVEIDRPLELMDLDLPSLKEGQVLVEVHYSGVCQTQINEIRGFKGEDKFLPHTLGHEGSGIVLEIGGGVQKVRPGDTVVMTWIKGSGKDVPSVQYRSGARIVNSGAISTFMTHAVVSENRLVPIQDVPMDIASLLGCAVPTGAGIVLNTLRAKRGSALSIWGLGGIGLSALLAARRQGCDPIIAVDIEESKLETAKKLGAHWAVHGKRDPVRRILEITNGRGCDYAVESAGKIETMEAAYASVRKGGGRLVVAGNPKKGSKLSLDPFDLIQGKEICGTWGGESDVDRDLARYAEFFRSGDFPIDKLVANTLSFPSINESLSLMESGKGGRILLAMKGSA